MSTRYPLSPYPYPVTNTDLKRYHKLEPHPEGGYYRETITLTSQPTQSQDGPTLSQKTGLSSDQLSDRVHIEAGSGVILGAETDGGKASGSDSKLEATRIYYLLDPSSSIGYLHVNLHAVTLHTASCRSIALHLHQPSDKPDEPPEIQLGTLGPDPTKSQVLQLFVPGGRYKATEIPREDLSLIDQAQGEEMRERIGAFITEVVLPGWTPKQCKIADEEGLKALWNGHSGWQEYIWYLTPKRE